MAFIVYDLHPVYGGNDYKLRREIRPNELARILIDYLRSENRDKLEISTWHIDQDRVLLDFGFDPATHAFVIDIKPAVNKNVSLCRLKEIWGYSNKWWTPVLLRLESIFIDKESEDPAKFKKEFNALDAEKEVLHEFLYLDAGTVHGKRRWGKTGYVNAALLWPDALRYFCSILKEYGC